MDVVTAYKKIKGQLVILLSGLSGSGKNAIGKQISKAFKIYYINSNKFYKKDYDKKEKIIIENDTREIVNWDSDDAVDWTSLNNKIDELKKDGVIVTGSVFPEDKITVKVDYHVHIKLPKQTILQNRKEYIEKHKDKMPKEFKIVNTPIFAQLFNKFTYPYYLDAIQRSKINKFINANEMDKEKIYSEVFDVLIEFIENVLYKDRPEYNRKPQRQKNRKQRRLTNQTRLTNVINKNDNNDGDEPINEYDRYQDLPEDNIDDNEDIEDDENDENGDVINDIDDIDDIPDVLY
ncbi:MAG: uridine kinase [Edafosvirus sp.]|uniref:Uridine kinase n=1 Tax=Edafosvirus sp. TaxID=2487765 RepID=A0A3G4ZU84_9VIRU|nr:MAG: uridine kinase [Edafosvirus sp.]